MRPLYHCSVRTPLMIVLLIFLFSHTEEKTTELKLMHYSAYSAVQCIMPDTFKIVRSESWNIGSAGITVVQFLERFPFQYLVIGLDTTRISSQSPNTLEPLYGIDTSMIVASPHIYDRYTLPQIFHDPANRNASTRWMIFADDTDLNCVAPGIIIEAQLDNDREREYIVDAQTSWYHHYMIYDSTSTGWHMNGAISLVNRWNTYEIDFKLRGYFGFQQSYGGTGLSALDINYYRLSGDSVQKAFSVSSYYALSFGLYRSDSADLSMTSASEVQVRLDGSIHVTVSVTVHQYELGSETESVFFDETVSYNLLRDASGMFHPDKNAPGFLFFCSEEYCDSTYFAPDAYAYAQLPYLKEHGTKQQQYLLKDFAFDSTAYFR